MTGICATVSSRARHGGAGRGRGEARRTFGEALATVEGVGDAVRQRGLLGREKAARVPVADVDSPPARLQAVGATRMVQTLDAGAGESRGVPARIRGGLQIFTEMRQDAR